MELFFLGLSGTGELLFPLGLWGLAILVQSQGIIYLLFGVFWKGNIKGNSKGSNGNWTMIVLEHHVLILRRFSSRTDCLGAIYLLEFWFL